MNVTLKYNFENNYLETKKISNEIAHRNNKKKQEMYISKVNMAI